RGEPRDLLRAHGGAQGRRPLQPSRRVYAAAQGDRRSRPGRVPRTEEPLLGEGGGRAEQRRAADRARPRGSGRRRVRARRVRGDGGQVPGGRREARTRGDRGPRALPALARAARPRRACRSGARDRTRGRRPRGAEDPRDGRGDRGEGHGGRVRPSRGAGRPRDRLRRAVSAGVARAPLPSKRRADRGGGAERGRVLMVERVFALPDLGEGLEEAEVGAWLVAEGDEVALNQPLAEVETAKAVVEIPSPFAGRVLKLHAAAGASVRVGDPLVTFEVAGQMPPSAAPETESPRPAATPAVRKLAKDLGVDLSGLRGSGRA